GFGVRAEIAVARRLRGCGIERARSAAEAAGTRAAEAARSRSAEPAGAARARAAGAAIFASARFAHRERTPVEHLPVEPLNRLLRVRTVGELDEGKSARSAGFTVDREHDLRGR